MNARKIVLLIVALIIAGGTAMMARSMLAGGQKKAADGSLVAAVEAPQATQVLVVARDVPAGTILKEVDLKWMVWPADATTEIYAVKGKAEMSAYVGSVVRQGMRVNEPVLAGRLVKANEQGFLSAVLMPGKRAITIPVTPASGIAGLVFPGDRVDVVVTHKITRKAMDGNATAEHKVSETMLSDVRVLALDQRTNDQAKEVVKMAQLATLEVSSRQAEQLALVAEMGTLSLVLRSLAVDQPTPADILLTQKALPTWDSDMSSVLSKPINRNGQVSKVQVMRGKETSEAVFDDQ